MLGATVGKLIALLQHNGSEFPETGEPTYIRQSQSGSDKELKGNPEYTPGAEGKDRKTRDEAKAFKVGIWQLSFGIVKLY